MLIYLLSLLVAYAAIWWLRIALLVLGARRRRRQRMRPTNVISLCAVRERLRKDAGP